MKIERGTIKAVIAVGVMLAAFVGAVLVPTSIQNARHQGRIEKAREDLGIGVIDKTSLERLRYEKQDLLKQVEDTGRSIPNEQGLSRVLQDLSGLINAPGVRDQQIITDKTKLYADYNIMPVKMQFSAPFATAFDMLNRIETLKYVVRIDKLDIEAEPDYPQQPLIVNLELSTFFAAVQQEGMR